jgi:hypothetical protein
MPLSQIIYASRFQFADDALQLNTISILGSARRTNPVLGLTGCLTYGRNWFLQVLEGDHAAVAEMMARISADQRHSELKVLLDRETKGRSFPEWSMACVDILRDMPGYISRGQADSEISPFTTPPLSLLMTMMNLADRSRSAV